MKDTNDVYHLKIQEPPICWDSYLKREFPLREKKREEKAGMYICRYPGFYSLIPWQSLLPLQPFWSVIKERYIINIEPEFVEDVWNVSCNNDQILHNTERVFLTTILTYNLSLPYVEVSSKLWIFGTSLQSKKWKDNGYLMAMSCAGSGPQKQMGRYVTDPSQTKRGNQYIAIYCRTEYLIILPEKGTVRVSMHMHGWERQIGDTSEGR